MTSIMKQTIYLLLLFISTLSFAQNETLFTEANQAYADENYEVAVSKYEKILDDGYSSKAVYFNLGNSHYKLNNVGPSIYYYEKALMLDPSDEDTQNNITYSRQMTIDAIDTVPKTGVSKLVNNIIGKLSVSGWAWLAVVASITFVVLMLLYYFASASLKKRLFFIFGSLSVIIAIVAIVFAFQQQDVMENQEYGIIFPEEVTVRAEPNPRAEQLFLLHEGTKARILYDFDDWRKIELADGKQGWMLKAEIKAL